MKNTIGCFVVVVLFALFSFVHIDIAKSSSTKVEIPIEGSQELKKKKILRLNGRGSKDRRSRSSTPGKYDVTGPAVSNGSSKSSSPKSHTNTPIKKQVSRVKSSPGSLNKCRSDSEPSIYQRPVRVSPNRKASAPLCLKPTIVIIEDEKVFQKIIKKLLENLIKNDLGMDVSDFNIIIVNNGKDAIEIHKANKPFLTFLDHNLDDNITGLDVITILRKNSETDPLHQRIGEFIAISAQAENNAAMNTKFVCQKPISLSPIKESLLLLFRKAHEEYLAALKPFEGKAESEEK